MNSSYWAIFVAIRAVDLGAINKFGLTNALTNELSSIIVRSFKKINDHVDENFKYQKLFVDDLVKSGRLGDEINSMTESYGFWIFYSLKATTLDYSNPLLRSSSKIIGEWLINSFISYWELVPAN